MNLYGIIHFIIKMSSDEIMQGFVISLFILCGISAFGYCARLRLGKTTTHGLKQSPSMEELSSVVTDDPQSN